MYAVACGGQRRPEEAGGLARPGVTGGCEQPCGYWKPPQPSASVAGALSQRATSTRLYTSFP